MFVRKSLRPTLFSLLTAAIFLASCTMGATPVPTVDVNAINTAAVATAMGQLAAQFTQTALAAPSSTPPPTNTAISLPSTAQATSDGQIPATASTLPTFSFNSTPNTTPLAGFTPLPTTGAGGVPATSSGPVCDSMTFEGDITIPDGSTVEGGTNFLKVWAIRNTGTCTWDDGYSLVYWNGSANNLDPYDFEFGSNANNTVAPGGGFNMTLELTAPCQPGEYEGHWIMESDRGVYFGDFLSVYIKVTESDCD
jgi:hypothetical protein